MNSVSPRPYTAKESIEGKIKLSYFGSVHTNRWKMIIKLAELLNLQNREDIDLDVYIWDETEQKILNLLSIAGINYKGSVSGGELEKNMLQSDILLHIESDDIHSISKTRLSISTKIPEYLISGRPILGFGPKNVASMRLLSDNVIGIIISPDDNNIEIQAKLEELIANAQLRTKLGKAGYDYAIKCFNNEEIRKEFNQKIEEILA
jgi:glycosyltransferase involved in cell wall biosynthesis